MRKLLHHGFTPRALEMQEPILHKYVSFLVEKMSERAMETTDGGVLDIVAWFNYKTFDIFGDLGFGEFFDCLQHSRYLLAIIHGLIYYSTASKHQGSSLLRDFIRGWRDYS
jgi:hypothetical protein